MRAADGNQVPASVLVGSTRFRTLIQHLRFQRLERSGATNGVKKSLQHLFSSYRVPSATLVKDRWYAFGTRPFSSEDAPIRLRMLCEPEWHALLENRVA